MMPNKNMLIASALMKCIARRLKFVGRFGSFFRKKYIDQMYKIVETLIKSLFR